MSHVGIVYLVGAGPGDPGLITARGIECLQQADLVLYDGLVNPLLLAHSHAACERTCRGGSHSDRIIGQDEINERLITAAKAGRTVVRLKGGDPYIFGRGSEEAAALAAEGIPFEVVPGVTAAVAASAYAGISLTHRDLSSAVAFITGHEDPAKPGQALDYLALAAFPGTLVFYMGLHRLPAIAESLIRAGKPPATPAAVISRGSTPLQRTVTATLAELPAKAKQAELHAPSIIVVGECVTQRDRIKWFESRPLSGVRVGITRPANQAGPTVARLLQLGGQPVLLPTIAVGPIADWAAVDGALARLDEFDWIVFTSVNGVRSLFDRLWSTGGDVRRVAQARLAAIGEGTAAALAEYRLRADVVPEEFRAEALARELSSHVAGRRVLWARASRGRDVLSEQLRAAGATLQELVVYENTDVEQFPPEGRAALERGEVDWIGLSSPSIARSLPRLLPLAAHGRLGHTLRLASLSPVTTAAAKAAGLPVHAEATTYTWDGLFDAIMRARQGGI